MPNLSLFCFLTSLNVFGYLAYASVAAGIWSVFSKSVPVRILGMAVLAVAMYFIGFDSGWLKAAATFNGK